MTKKKKSIPKRDNNGDKLFKFINPWSNDRLSEMKGIDLYELFHLLDDYYLEYRNILGFDKYITFGLELEFEHAMNDRIKNKLHKKFESWDFKTDITVITGAEVSSPILRNEISTWEDLDGVCKIISNHASIGVNSGGHIHIGAHVLGENPVSWLNFLKIWSVYENIIYRFAYGEFLTARSSIRVHAAPLMQLFWIDYKKMQGSKDIDVYNVIDQITSFSSYAVNFQVTNPSVFIEYNTIEVRCPNGTLEPIIWQNNVNFFVKLLLYARSASFNDDLVQERYNHNGMRYSLLSLYNEIYIQQALELCDMVFDNNFDKIYFLRQYLKSFQIENKFEKAKPFVRTRK